MNERPNKELKVARVTPDPPGERSVRTPPDDATQAYARRLWRDVKALLIACCVVGGGVIAILLMLGYGMAGIGGVAFGAIIGFFGLVLLARKLLTH